MNYRFSGRGSVTFKSEQRTSDQILTWSANFVSEESIELYHEVFQRDSQCSNVRLLGVTPIKPGEVLTCIQSDPADQGFDDSFSPDFPLD